MNTANEYLAQFLGGSSTAFSPTIIVASMGLDNIDWDEIIAGNVKPKFVELNQKALHAGMEAVS